MAYSNAAVQKMIDDYGDRIFCIMWDNGFKLFIGYPSSEVKSVSELVLTDIAGTEVIGVPAKSSLPTDRKNGVSFTSYHSTDLIQHIAVMDEGFEDFRIDPMIVH